MRRRESISIKIMECSVESVFWQISEDIEHIIESMKLSKEQYEQHQTTLYWLGVRMSNSKSWRECDVEVVEQLHILSETMMTYTDTIAKTAEDILDEVQMIMQLKSYEENQWNMDMYLLRKKIDMLHLFFKEYEEQQTKYLKCIRIVNEILNQHKPLEVTMFSKIKQLFFGRK